MPRKHIECVDYAPNGQFVVIGGENGVCAAYDPLSGNLIQNINRFGPKDDVIDVSISADSRLIAACALTDTVKVWDFENDQTWKHEFTVSDGVMLEAAFSPDNQLLAASLHAKSRDSDVVVMVWELQTGKVVHSLQYGENWGRNRRYLQFTADNRHLLIGFEWGGAILWDIDSAAALIQLKYNNHDKWDVDLSPDNSCIMTSEGDIHIWDVATKSVVKTISGFDHLATKFSPDGKYLLIATFRDDKDLVVLYDLATDKVVQEFMGHAGSINCIKLSPDGSRLLTGSYDCTARIWDVASGQELVCIRP